MAYFAIDKSRFNAKQLETYEALVEIGKVAVDPAGNHEEAEGEEPETPPKKTNEKEVDTVETTKKSAPEAPEMAPELKAALDELATLKKSYEMDKMIEVAKKYAPLGKKEEELAQTLLDMKKSNEANYNAYIAILDESLGYVEKSGLFSEVGKSSRGSSVAGGSAVDKAEAKAREIQKSNPGMSHDEAIAKAWMENPDLVAEYDKEYFA